VHTRTPHGASIGWRSSVRGGSESRPAWLLAVLLLIRTGGMFIVEHKSLLIRAAQHAAQSALASLMVKKVLDLCGVFRIFYKGFACGNRACELLSFFRSFKECPQWEWGGQVKPSRWYSPPPCLFPLGEARPAPRGR
jgi:hypothetical protein